MVKPNVVLLKAWCSKLKPSFFMVLNQSMFDVSIPILHAFLMFSWIPRLMSIIPDHFSTWHYYTLVFWTSKSWPKPKKSPAAPSPRNGCSGDAYGYRGGLRRCYGRCGGFYGIWSSTSGFWNDHWMTIECEIPQSIMNRWGFDGDFEINPQEWW